MKTDSLFWRTTLASCFYVLESCWTAFLFEVCIWGGGGEISFKLSSYYSPVLVVECGCGSMVLSPASTDQFKRLILVFSLVTKQLRDTMWTSVREPRCALGAGSFLFPCNLPVWKSGELVCPLSSPCTSRSSQRMSGAMAALIAHKNSQSFNAWACLEASCCVSRTFIWS